MATTTPAPWAPPSPRAPTLVPAPAHSGGKTKNVIYLEPDPMRPEWFTNLFACLERTLRMQYPESSILVAFDPSNQTYGLLVDNIPRLHVSTDRIALESGTDEEVALAVQVAIDMGWPQLRLSGTEDFKRRAFEEAVRRGFAPHDVSGYSPQPAPPQAGGIYAETATNSHAPQSRARRRTR